uniref:Cation efflux protein n=1 Tax=Chlorobium chlorochromatii (strain CaD3) TaxID=340177 RepID=Q3ARH0_CHLCH
MTAAQQNIAFQKVVAVTGVLLFVIKMVAWYLTSSVAILTDALESTVNVVSGFIGLYSLYLAAQPRDNKHPYGHGKVEFVSAAIEGTLISIAGLLIVYEALKNLLGTPRPLGQLDYGIALIGVTAVVNYVVGAFAVRQGTKNNSLALIASGKHLQSDTYSTIGITLGLLLLFFTKQVWLDSVVALIFAGVILATGYHIIRDALSGIMDAADESLLKKMVDLLQAHREPQWVDLHNLRIIKYGATLHLDCHVTLPWFFTVRQAEEEVQKLGKLVDTTFGDSLDLSVQSDSCNEALCSLCRYDVCSTRRKPFSSALEWTVENLSSNHHHYLSAE